MTSCPPVPKFKREYDSKYTVPKPEHLIPNTLYTLSINPEDKEQYFNEKDRVVRFKEQWYGRLLINLAPYANYDLYLEISEAGRLHFHGTITVTDVLGFYANAIPFMRANMTYEIDTIKDANWLTVYCVKQAHLFDGGVNPRVKSAKDPLFLINKGRKGSIVTSKRIITFDDYN